MIATLNSMNLSLMLDNLGTNTYYFVVFKWLGITVAPLYREIFPSVFYIYIYIVSQENPKETPMSYIGKIPQYSGAPLIPSHLKTTK